MGLPDNRDIEPMRDDSLNDYNNDPGFVMHQIEENEQQMEIEDEPDNGYSILQTFDGEELPANDSDSSGSDDEDDGNEYIFNSENVEESSPQDPAGLPFITSTESEIQAQIWNGPRPEDTIELNSEKTQQIIKAMSKFTLPNIPQWASEVNPRELIQRIKNKETPIAAPNDKK